MEIVFSNTSVTLHPHTDRVIVMDLPYLQKLSVLLAETKPVMIGEFLSRYLSSLIYLAIQDLKVQKDMSALFHLLTNNPIV